MNYTKKLAACILGICSAVIIPRLCAYELLHGVGGCLFVCELPASELETRILKNIHKLPDLQLAIGKLEFSEISDTYSRNIILETNPKLRVRRLVLHWLPDEKSIALAMGPKWQPKKTKRSDIDIFVGSYPSNGKKSFIEFRRWWTLIGRSHIPYTDIMLWKSDYTFQLLLNSDLDFISTLADNSGITRVKNVNISSSELIKVLTAP